MLQVSLSAAGEDRCHSVETPSPQFPASLLRLSSPTRAASTQPPAPLGASTRGMRSFLGAISKPSASVTAQPRGFQAHLCAGELEIQS